MSTKHGVIWVVGLCLAGANGCSIPCDPGYYREGDWCIRYEPDGGDAAVGDSAIPDTSAPNDSGADATQDAGPVQDGSADACATVLFRDEDGDGYGNPSNVELVCPGTRGFADRAGDCLDTNAGVNPDSREICNGIDDNCDGTTDEGLRIACYPDSDSDGVAASQTSMQVCAATGRVCPTGFTPTRPASVDCNDRNPCATASCMMTRMPQRFEWDCAFGTTGLALWIRCPNGFHPDQCVAQRSEVGPATCGPANAGPTCNNGTAPSDTFNVVCSLSSGIARCEYSYACVANAAYDGACSS